MNFDIALIGYSASAVAFLILTGLLLTVWRDRTRGSLLTLTSTICAIWGAVLAYYSTQVAVPTSRVLLTEMVHDGAWLIEGAIELDAFKPDGTPRKLLDTSRLSSLGWKPSIDLERGIRSTHDWYTTHVHQ